MSVCINININQHRIHSKTTVLWNLIFVLIWVHNLLAIIILFCRYATTSNQYYGNRNIIHRNNKYMSLFLDFVNLPNKVYALLWWTTKIDRKNSDSLKAHIYHIFIKYRMKEVIVLLTLQTLSNYPYLTTNKKFFDWSNFNGRLI